MSKGSINLPIVSKFDPTGLRQAESAIGKFGGALKNIGIAAFATASAAAIAGVGVAVTKGFGRLQQIENARNLLQGIGNDAATVEQAMDSALASVKGTAFGLGEAAQIAATAVAAGVKPGEELTRYLTLVADAATVAQVPLEQMGSTLNKVTTIGKAQNDTLRVLAEQGIPVYQYLADQLGVTAEEVFNLAREGEISAEMLQTALIDNIGGAALTAGDTVQGAFANVEAAISRIGANLLSNTYDQLPGFFQGLIDVLEPLEGVAQDVGKELGSAMEPVFKSILDILPQLITGLMPIVSLFGTMASTILPPLINVFGALAPIIGRVAELFADALLQVMPIVVELIERLIPIIVMVVDAILPLIEMALPIFIELLQLFIDIVMPIIEGILPILVSLFSTLVPIILEIIQAFMPLIVELLPLFMLTLELAFPLIQFFADLLGVVLPAAFDMLQSLGLVPSAEAIGYWAEGLGNVVGAVRGFFIGAMNNLIEILVKAANTFISTINAIIDRGRSLPGALGAIYRRIPKLDPIQFVPISIDFAPFVLPKPQGMSFEQYRRERDGLVNKGFDYAGINFNPYGDSSDRGNITRGSNIPAMAEGGIVNRATLALIGEAGSEAVIPLDKLDKMGGNVYNITVNAGMGGANGTEIGREIVSAIRRYERTSGRVFASA
jgi:tape measure domain-containing protein